MHRTLVRQPDALFLRLALPALFLAAAPFAFSAARAAEDPHARYAPPGARIAKVLTDRAVARLEKGGGHAVLWVYFADKGETDARSFERAVRRAGDRFTDRARARRAREAGGRFEPDYYDVPVVSGYLGAVRRTGASIRHVSRWLNAVSVEADRAAADRLAELPFVRLVTPVAYSKRVEPVGAETPVESPTQGEGPQPPGAPGRLGSPGMGGAPAALAPSDGRQLLSPSLGPPAGYGSSITQLNGLNAKAAQDSGYTGANVIVAMLDTGYNKGHDATVQLKRIAEFDFVFNDGETANEAEDFSTAWNHGTGTWSVLGGYFPNTLIGPAYNASFLLAKTEDVRSETPIEEDNWLAAVEWADSLGADVISSSLAYKTFDNPPDNHDYSDMNGQTTTVTLAAALAARRGIIVANAMANSGPSLGTLQAPADADSILSVGAVDSGNLIAGFSSRGPTFDGRGKPEVVAQGVNTTWAVASNNSFVVGVNGTSLATPLIGGGAAQVREAHPEWTVQQIRYALKVSGDKSSAPDSNTYGWGRPNVVSAIYSSPLGGPVFPKPFNLLAPVNNAAVTTAPVVFLWRKAIDLNPGDVLSYRIIVKKASVDSTILDATTSDTSFAYSGYLGPSQTYTWNVTATDLLGHGRVSREPFAFLTGTITDVAASNSPPGVPQFALLPNRPNPIHGSTQIPFSIWSAKGTGVAHATLRIFDSNGRLVRTLFEDDPYAVPSASYETWDGRDENGRRVGSGIYYYRLTVAGKVISRRMVVVR